jgi:hypothetical protein
LSFSTGSFVAAIGEITLINIDRHLVEWIVTVLLGQTIAHR